MSDLVTGIIDIHHGDGAYDLAAAKAAGIVALFHKATEGQDWRDKGFARAMDAAKVHGLLRGAYHFGSASASGAEQADFFLGVVAPLGPDVLLALDLERNPGSAGTMTTEEGAAFLLRVYDQTGRWPLLYAGRSELNTRVAKASPVVRAILARAPLWLAQYGEPPTTKQVPSLWPDGWSLWQYTSSLTNGPSDRARYPRGAPGFTRRSQDRSCFRGTPEELRAFWSSVGRDTSLPRHRTITLGNAGALVLEQAEGEFGPVVRMTLDPGGPSVDVPAALVEHLIASGAEIARALRDLVRVP